MGSLSLRVLTILEPTCRILELSPAFSYIWLVNACHFSSQFLLFNPQTFTALELPLAKWHVRAAHGKRLGPAPQGICRFSQTWFKWKSWKIYRTPLYLMDFNGKDHWNQPVDVLIEAFILLLSSQVFGCEPTGLCRTVRFFLHNMNYMYIYICTSVFPNHEMHISLPWMIAFS